MARGRWFGAKTSVQLTAEWGVKIAAVQNYASEASGIIRRVVEGDPAEIKAEIIAGIQSIQQLALDRQRTWVTKDGSQVTVEEPDFRVALDALLGRARLLGLGSDRVELTGKDGAPLDLSGMTNEELIALAAGKPVAAAARGGGAGAPPKSG